MAFYLLGECCAWLINDFVPGSVLGMMFLFLALSMRWVRPERVRPVARFLCDNMAFFFLPAGVGIITSMDVLSRYWDIVLVVGTVTTVPDELRSWMTSPSFQPWPQTGMRAPALTAMSLSTNSLLMGTE